MTGLAGYYNSVVGHAIPLSNKLSDTTPKIQTVHWLRPGHLAPFLTFAVYPERAARRSSMGSRAIGTRALAAMNWRQQ